MKFFSPVLSRLLHATIPAASIFPHPLTTQNRTSNLSYSCADAYTTQEKDILDTFNSKDSAIKLELTALKTPRN